jgi:hypothetical protein
VFDPASGVFRGGAVVRPPPPFGVVYAGSGPGPPPPLAVIRGAVGGVWLVFEEVYGAKLKKCEKLLKKRVVKIFSDRNFGWSAS